MEFFIDKQYSELCMSVKPVSPCVFMKKRTQLTIES